MFLCQLTNKRDNAHDQIVLTKNQLNHILMLPVYLCL